MKLQDLIIIEDLEKALAYQHNLAREATIKMLAERSRCLKAVDDEPEWKLMSCHYMPDVTFAKKNMRKRIKADKKRPAVQHLVTAASAAMYDQKVKEGL